MNDGTSEPGLGRSQIVTPYDRVLSIFEDFRGAWRSDGRPSMATYLDRAGGGLRATLLRNLLEFEIRQRRGAGDPPRASEYLGQFPEDSALVRQVFLESVASLTTLPPIDAGFRSGGVDGSGSGISHYPETRDPGAGLGGDATTTQPVQSPLPPGTGRANGSGDSTNSGASDELDGLARSPASAPAALRIGDYRLIRELGRGGMGVVYEAVHISRGHPVALKLLPEVDGSRLYRFKREFRSAAGLSHPNLIGLHNLEADGDQWFFTMELVEGTTFLEYVRPDGRLDEARLRPALAQLVMGVMALHGHHIIHRDLKPSNVMVTPEGRVLILDFGLVLELQEGNPWKTADNFAGTPAYMAPEQIMSGALTPSCDWYAVGTMLHEALAGTLPFQGSVGEILQAKMNDDPPGLPRDAAIPSDLAAISRRLLARDASARPDAFEIAKRVASGLGQAPAIASHGPSTDRLIGRESHLRALDVAYRSLEEGGEPQTVFILGRSGEGKSTLAEHFLAKLRAGRRSVVMAGRCYDRESVPFKALDALVDALASYLHALPEVDAALLMPDDVGVLARVFPVLQRVQVVARAGGGKLTSMDEQQVRSRAFRALRSLLGRIGRRSPIVWFIDDLQWGDADSAEALFELLKPPEAPRVLFLGAYRSDEAEGSRFLKMWKDLQRKGGLEFDERPVKLAPLTVDECAELLVKLLGKDTEAIRARAEEFARETRGNPFLLIELVGCFDPEADTFEPIPLHEVLTRKLARLPAEASELLEVLAASGQAISLDEASTAAGHELPQVATVSRMRNERLVRMVGPDEAPLIDTYHDRVRETVLDRMGAVRCGEVHGTLAGVIEQGMGGLPLDLVESLERGEVDLTADGPAIPRVFDLAYHFDAAGVPEKARTYALLAAGQARRQSALEVTVTQYAVAARNASEASAKVRNRIAEGSAEALTLLGRYDDANRHLDLIVGTIEGSERRARIDHLRGEIAIRQGALDSGNASFERGLRTLGQWVPKGSLRAVAGLAREALAQAHRTAFPRRTRQERATGEADAAILIKTNLARSYMFQNLPKTIWSQMSAMNQAERYEPTPLLALGYACHSCICAMLGWKRRAADFRDRSITLSRGFDDLWGQGQCFNFTGVGEYANAEYESGIASLDAAVDAFEKAGDLWLLHVSHFHRGLCHFGLGNLAEAVAEARWTFASSARLGDNRIFCSSYLWARATGGDFPFDELRGCIPDRPDDVMSSVHGLMAEGLWHSHHGRTAEALGVTERAAAMVRTSLCVNSHTILVLPMLARATRLHAEALLPSDPREARRFGRKALRLARWSARVSPLVPAARAFATRELALSLFANGSPEKALAVADRSCAIAEAQKAKYEIALSTVARWRIAESLGKPGAVDQLRQAEAALLAMEKAARTSPSPA
jgi:eukaryotic-like serine/threonine-protein kinase